jgi:peroxiredoxin
MKWIDRLFGGPTDMAALTAGTQAPEVSLPTVDGSKFAWQDALKKGPVVAAFFKVSCPVCQYAFPFLERLHQAYGDKKIAIIGVSQDDAAKSKAFMSEYGVTFPVLIDDPNG